MKFSYIGTEVTVSGKKIKLFDAPAKIQKVIMPEDNLLIFLLNVYHVSLDETDYNQNRNIFCINESGEVVWQIEEVPEKYCRFYNGEIMKEPFMGLWIDEKGVLKVGSSSAYDFDVDIKTGKLSNAEFTK